ncbi:hypothetical protein [Jiangella aurantiaca]|nr:hypothetical protein [Jiangella aurantiaca]
MLIAEDLLLLAYDDETGTPVQAAVTGAIVVASSAAAAGGS